MLHPDTTTVDGFSARYTDAVGKYAEIRKKQAALAFELSAAATDAEAAGIVDFAEMFRELAMKLGLPGQANGKTQIPAPRRRGRPPKATEDSASED